MSNPYDLTLDVLASNPAEVKEIHQKLMTLNLDIEFVRNLGWVHDDKNTIRRFKHYSRTRYAGRLRDGILSVSEAFPNAVFLLEECDLQYSWSSKTVIRAGEVVQQIFDGDHKAQGIDWALLDIFAPFIAEHKNGSGFGTLWNAWLDAITAAFAKLREVKKGLL